MNLFGKPLDMEHYKILINWLSFISEPLGRFDEIPCKTLRVELPAMIFLDKLNLLGVNFVTLFIDTDSHRYRSIAAWRGDYIHNTCYKIQEATD